MAVDAERRRLWLTTAGTPSMIDYSPEEHEGRSELLGFDLDTGELQARIAAPAAGDAHELNDLIIDADGSVLVGDAPVGAIYRLSPGSDSFEIVVEPGSMFSPQGIVILPGGGQTLVADYSRGLCRLRPDGRVQVLRSPTDAWLGGIDGLSLSGRRELIAVQNGITPNRVVRIRLNEVVDAVASVDVLDLAHPEHDQPTLGEVVGNDFLYVANSLWGAWDREGNPVKGRKLTPPVILRIALSSSQRPERSSYRGFRGGVGGFRRSALMTSWIARSSWGSPPFTYWAGSSGTSMSGSTPYPSMIHSPSRL
jgi:hypothetical protein